MSLQPELTQKKKYFSCEAVWLKAETEFRSPIPRSLLMQNQLLDFVRIVTLAIVIVLNKRPVSVRAKHMLPHRLSQCEQEITIL